MTTPREVIEAFGRLTGIQLREPYPQYVMAQAAQFAKYYQLDELELVVLWTKREIARSKGGYSPSSLQWHVIFGRHGAGDEMLTFQERLGLSMQAVKGGWRAPVESASNGTEKPAKPSPQPPEQKVSEEEGKRTAGLLGALRNELEGRG